MLQRWHVPRLESEEAHSAGIDDGTLSAAAAAAAVAATWRAPAMRKSGVKTLASLVCTDVEALLLLLLPLLLLRRAFEMPWTPPKLLKVVATIAVQSRTHASDCNTTINKKQQRVSSRAMRNSWSLPHVHDVCQFSEVSMELWS